MLYMKNAYDLIAHSTMGIYTGDALGPVLPSADVPVLDLALPRS